MVIYPILLALGIAAVVVLLRRRQASEQQQDLQRQARTLRCIAFGAMALSTAVGGLFIVGETVSDPGGWAAVGLIGVWGVPLAVVGVLAWRRPELGLAVLGGMVGVMVLVGVWFALDPHGWREFEDSRGPVRTIATFAIAAAIALVGLRRPGRAGLELVVLALVPPLLSSLGSRAGSASLFAVATVPLLAGVLYLMSAQLSRIGRPPRRYGPAH